LRTHRIQLRLPLVALLLAACSNGDRPSPGDRGGTAAGPAVASIAQPSAADTTCPPNGLWAECSLLKRLDRAGLVVQRDSAAPTEEPLTREGILFRVGGRELEVYLYPDAASRERAQRQLDSTGYVRYTGSQTFRAEPTLIGNANLIAILHSNNSKQRERVGDAITAGPPQPLP
jgi:hypothetical protein